MVPAKEKQKYVLAPSDKKRTMKCFLAAQSHSHSSFIAKAVIVHGRPRCCMR